MNTQARQTQVCFFITKLVKVYIYILTIYEGMAITCKHISYKIKSVISEKVETEEKA